MELYRVRLKNDRFFGVGVDVINGFAIAAISAPAARRLAAENAANEGRQTWFMPKESSCELIGKAKPGQKIGIILFSHNAR